MKETYSTTFNKLPRSAKVGLMVGAGGIVGGIKGSLGSLMSDKGTLGSGFVEGGAYGAAGTALTVGSFFAKDMKFKHGLAAAGLGIASAALFCYWIWQLTSTICCCWTWHCGWFIWTQEFPKIKHYDKSNKIIG